MEPQQLAEIFKQLKEKKPVLYEELEKQIVELAEHHEIKVEQQKKDE